MLNPEDARNLVDDRARNRLQTVTRPSPSVQIIAQKLPQSRTYQFKHVVVRVLQELRARRRGTRRALA